MCTWVEPEYQPASVKSDNSSSVTVRPVTRPSEISTVFVTGRCSKPRTTVNSSEPTGTSTRKMPG